MIKKHLTEEIKKCFTGKISITISKEYKCIIFFYDIFFFFFFF